MTVYNQLSRFAFQIVASCSLCLCSTLVFADQTQRFAIGDEGEIVADSSSTIEVNESNGKYSVNLVQGGLCFSVNQTTPLTITAGGKVVAMENFGAEEAGMISGLVSADDVGVYAGSAATCAGVTSVITEGDGLFGLGLEGTILFGTGIILLGAIIEHNDNNNVVAPIMPDPEVQPVIPDTTTTTVTTPTRGGGGGGGAVSPS